MTDETPGGAHATILATRGVLRVAGPDVRPFLQGVISNDITKVTRDRAIWAALLTPQGKFLHEFFIAADPAASDDATLLLECEAARRDDLRRRLSLYKLRAKVTLDDASDDYVVAALFGQTALTSLGLAGEPGSAKAFGGGLVFVDPRLGALGARAILPRNHAESVLAEAGFAMEPTERYERLRLSLGVPEGSRDLEVEKALLLENGFDELHGVDWGKGCFVGQELTARMKYRALVKKRLLPVAIAGAAPEPGTAVLADGKEAGVLRSVSGDRGLALLRLEHVTGNAAAPLRAGDAVLTVEQPNWLVVPESASSGR